MIGRPPIEPETDYEWMGRGACSGRKDIQEWFFADLRTPEVRAAKVICSACAVRSECLAYALPLWHLEGVWGGTDVEERKKLRRRRQKDARQRRAS